MRTDPGDAQTGVVDERRHGPGHVGTVTVGVVGVPVAVDEIVPRYVIDQAVADSYLL